MNCKFCNYQMGDDAVFCPKCGKRQTETKKPKIWMLIAALLGCLVLLSVLVVSVLEGMGIDATGTIAGIFRKPETVQEDPAPTQDSDIVVATMGDRELTNGELQVYYWTHVFDFINQYYYYGLPFDPAVALSEQTYDPETGETWHDYFLDMSFKTWQRYETMDIIAKEHNLSLSKESQDYLDNLEEYLAQTATDGGFESADAMIADRFGPGCAYRHYRAFAENYLIGMDFVDMMATTKAPSMEEIELYYNENVEELTKYNAAKDSGNISNVRHILFMPKVDEGATSSTDAQWAEALANAEKILAQWKAGEATEESFTALAIAHSEDTGITKNQGLYERVAHDTGYVPAFEAWAADPTRQPGQTGIVKTEHGYHVMYCVSTEPLWVATCRQAILTQQISALVDTKVEENPMITHTDKVVLGDATEGKF